jgi:chromatin assembly factor 1 subunit A
MEDPTPLATFSQKRPHDDDVQTPVTTPVKAIQSEASTPLSVLSVRTPSPFKSHATSNTTAPSSSSNPFSTQAASAPSNAQQPAKRRKLTQKEKDDQQLEKEAKAKARAEKKAQKDAEDKLKEEEKQKKAEEREEKRRQKEEEQQQKEAEKLKKERVSITQVRPGTLANPASVANEAQRLLRETKSHGHQSWKGLGRVHPDAYRNNIIITKFVWNHH